MGKKSGPAAPDYTSIANTQADTATQNTAAQTAANRPDQYTPFGNSTWSSSAGVDPSTGKPITNWSQTTTLDPTLQGALNSQLSMQQGRSDIANSLMGGVASTLGTPLDYGQFSSTAGTPTATNSQAFSYGGPGVQSSLDYGNLQGLSSANDARAAAEKATYGSMASRLDPQYANAQRDLETKLANQGISQNSDAYTRAMDDFNRSKTDAYSQANLAAVNAGGTAAQQNYGMDLSTRQQQANEATNQGNYANSAQAQMFGQGLQGAQQGMATNAQNYGQQMSSANYQNQLRQQQIAEALQQRGMGLNEINSLMSGQQVMNPTFQSFGQAGAAATPDLLGAATAQYGAAQNSQSSSNAFGGQLLGAASSMLGNYFSDRRTKQILGLVRRDPRGFGIYRFRYIGERGERIGVIAQQVQRVMPQAVVNNSGVLMVNYSMLGGLAA